MAAFRFIVFALPVVLLSACVNNRKEYFATPSDESKTKSDCLTPIPDSVSFKNDLIPIFASNCAIASCHSGSRPEGNLNLEASVAYIQIIRVSRDYLNISKPFDSQLYNSLTSPANLMPPSGKMPDCKIDLIMKWMGQGARNN